MNSMEKTRYPLMERPMIAFILAIAAGSMDGYTYFTAKSFSTVMSGNIILLGQTLTMRDMTKFSAIALTILCFGLGSAVTAILQKKSESRHKTWTFEILLIEGVILFLLGFTGINQLVGLTFVCMTISFLAGMQGNAFHKIDGMLYGNVAVTLVVQLAFSYLAQAFFRKENASKNSGLFFLVLLGFAFGGFLGTFLTIHWAEKALWVTAGILLVVALTIKLIKNEETQEGVDPV